MFARKLTSKIMCLIMALCMLAVSVLGVKFDCYARPSESSFWIEYIDIGQGDSALVQCDGHYMMIDGGPSSASRIIYSILRDREISEIDVMVASHADADHIGGLAAALKRTTVGKVYCPVTEYDTRPFRSMLKYMKKQGLTITVPKPGDTFKLGSAEVEILGPISESEESNDMSIVARITYGDTAFLFTGDAEEPEETELVSSRTDLSCDVLKVSHHGSAYSTTSAFLDAAKPTYAVISVGKDNSYGHPTIEALDRLNECGVKLYRTDLQGDIICESDGRNISFTTEKSVTDFELWRAGDGEDADTAAGTAKSTGASTAATTTAATTAATSTTTTGSSTSTATTGASTAATTTAATTAATSDPTEITYVVNTNTGRFHIPTCRSVSQMKDKNRMDVTLTRDELIDQGYTPCGNCHP